jgi:hypothetical protein
LKARARQLPERSFPSLSATQRLSVRSASSIVVCTRSYAATV